jgi:hypothetical protein
MNLVTQRSELVDAGNVKRILENLTGDEYVLKTRAELVNPDNMSWYVHIPLGRPSYVSHVYEAGGKIVFESPILYEVYQDMEYRFSESKYVRLREKLGGDVDGLLEKKVREKYKELMPQVVRFLDQAQEIVSKVNQQNTANLSLNNDHGSITLAADTKALGIEANEPTIKRIVLAMKGAVVKIGEWQDEQRAKSVHMGQIRNMHRELLGTDKQ